MQWLQQGGNKISMWQTEINTCDGTGKPPAYEMIPAIKDLYKPLGMYLLRRLVKGIRKDLRLR